MKNFRAFLIVLVIGTVFLFPSITFAQSVTIQLNDAKISDLAKVVYGDLLNRSYILDSDLLREDDQVTINWRNLSPAQVNVLTGNIFTERGYELEVFGQVLRIRKTKKDDQSIMIYLPKYRSGRYLSDVIQKVIGVSQLSTRGIPASPQQQAAIAQQPDIQGSAALQIDKSANDQLAYECLPALCFKLNRLLAQLDTPEAQVVLRAALYEVGTTKGEGSAFQVAAKLFKGSLQFNTGSTILGGSSIHLAGSNLDAILSILDQDSRFHVVSRPMLRVKTGTQAKFSVGSQVPILGSVSQDKNGNPVQSVDYKQSGTIFTVQPDVRQEVIDLTITQELSSFVATTTGVNNTPTMLQRTANSTLSIRSGEVVVFAGLEENRDDDSTNSLFGFSLGKKKNSTSSEVLLFIEAQRI